jgi:hypothetical protein
MTVISYNSLVCLQSLGEVLGAIFLEDIAMQMQLLQGRVVL